MAGRCARCGAAFDQPKGPGHGKRRYCLVCSPRRQRGGSLAAVPAAPVALVPVRRGDPDAAAMGPIETGVRAELDALGRAGCIDALAALDAARTLDGDPTLTGAARASLLREMRSAADAARKGATPAGGRLDELRARRGG